MTSKQVLVGVLKNRRDRRILFAERWYRIPREFAPKKKYVYVAFYQPAIFGKHGRRIEYYGKVSKITTRKRVELLPAETAHPRAREPYLKITFSEITKLPRAIRNIIPRRICFGFTDLPTLRSARDILELYGVPAIEQIVQKRLARLGTRTVAELPVAVNGKRFRIDLAIVSPTRKIAIECDNTKAHGIRSQILKDKIKDDLLRRAGWHVIRLKEKDIIENLDACVSWIARLIARDKSRAADGGDHH